MSQLIIQRPIGHAHAGDQQVDMLVEPDLAQTLFDEAIANGYLPVVAKAPGKEEQLFPEEFTPQLEHDVILYKRLVGG